MEPVLGASLDELRTTRTSVKWRRWGPDVLPAWVAEMDARPCPAVVDAVTDAMRRGDTGYTWSEPYVAAVAGFASDRWGWELDPETVEVAADVMVGVLDVLRVVTDPGGSVVVSPPVYNAFYGFIEGYGWRVGEAPLDAQDRLDPRTLRVAFEEAARGGGRSAYLLCNPHNPTGTVHTRAELEMLAALADEFGIQVVSDEIHAPLVHAEAGFTPYLTVGGAADCGVSVFSASKAFNLAGLRCAVTIPGPAAVALTSRVPEVARHGASHLGAIAQAAALTDGREWLDRLIGELDVNRRHLADRLAADLPEVGYRVPAATYLAWLDLRATGLGEDPAAELVGLGGVGLSSGPDYGDAGRGFARLNFATSPEVLDEVVDRVRTGVRAAHSEVARRA